MTCISLFKSFLTFRIFLRIYCLIGISIGFLYGQKAESLSPIFTKHTHYTTQDGLPQSNVTEVQQDADGFIWVSSAGGLARFDGRKFLQIEQGLASNQILDIHIDESNRLWIWYYNRKVGCMNPRTFQVTTEATPAASISKEDHALRLDVYLLPRILKEAGRANWFVDDTVNYKVYDAKSRLLPLFKSGVSEPDIVHTFLLDQEGLLWKMTQTGLAVSDESLTNFTAIDVPAHFDYKPLEKDTQTVMFELPDSRIVFSYLDRIFIFNRKSNSFTELTVPTFYRRSMAKLDMVDFDMQGRPIFELDGVFLRLDAGDNLVPIWEYPNRRSLSINSFFIDDSNTLWVAANTDGLYKIDLNTPSFHPTEYTYNLIVDVLHGELGIAYKDMPQNWLKKGWSYGLRYLYTPDGKLLLTNEDRHYGHKRALYEVVEGKFRQISMPLNDIRYVIGIDYYKNDYWAMDYGGVLMPLNNLKGVRQEIPVISDYLESKGLPSEPANNISIMGSSADEDFIWALGTDKRLYQIKDQTVQEVFVVGGSSITTVDLMQDERDDTVLWIATLSGGLLKWDKKSKKVERSFTKVDGLADNKVAGIVGDSLGNLWIATFNGLSKFNIDQSTFTNYSMNEGLYESEFNRYHVFALPDGTIAMGGTKGYIHFNPYEFSEDHFQPEVNITQFSLNNQVVDYSDTSALLSRPINQLEELSLSYNQNGLSFEFAAAQYNDPSKTKYRYELSGYTSGWVEIANDNQVRWDKLPWGTYTLKLNATNTRGDWSRQVKMLTIKISPPPWLSWWAYTLYALTISFLTFLFWRNYKRKLIREQEEAFNKKEAIRLREMDEMKTRFFSNITHEFRTPLTLILSPLDKHLKEGSLDPEALKILKNNYKHGSHLLNLVNQLLDIAKLESGNMQLNAATGELKLFVQEVVNGFDSLAEQKEIELIFHETEVSGHYLFDRNHWEKILNNLLSNAIKFTPNGGKVEVFLSQHGEAVDMSDMAILQVMDSGIGIAEDEIPKLFDRFYQVDDSETRHQEGTGIGLALVKELVDLMGGTIQVESQLNKGTTFTVELPITKLSETAPEETAEESETVDVKRLHIGDQEKALVLVVEDNQELRDFIVESLREHWDVMEAQDGSRGWELILEHLPDIVISDVMMPGMSGYELCELTKKDLRTAHINFVMLTAKSSQKSKELGLSSGADDYLTKPFHLHELELRIQNQLNQQHRLREHLQIEMWPSTHQMPVQRVKDAFIEKLRNFIFEHIGDSSLDIEALTSEMAMSRSTLNRKLKAVLDISANDFIKQCRLQHAAVLIRSGEGIAEAAFKVGFESASYFAQCFKEMYHQTPTEFQKEQG